MQTHIKFLEHQYNQAYKELDFETAEEFYRIKEILIDLNGKAGQVEPVVMPESNGQVKYAIKHKDKFMLMQVSNSEKQLGEKIETAYWLAQGIQPKGINYTKEDFMKDMERVKVTFEKIG